MTPLHRRPRLLRGVAVSAMLLALTSAVLAVGTGNVVFWLNCLSLLFAAWAFTVLSRQARGSVR